MDAHGAALVATPGSTVFEFVGELDRPILDCELIAPILTALIALPVFQTLTPPVLLVFVVVEVTGRSSTVSVNDFSFHNSDDVSLIASLIGIPSLEGLA